MPRIKRVSSTPLPQAKRVKLNRDEPLPKHLCPPTAIWGKIVQHARLSALATLLLVDKRRSAMVTARVNQVYAGTDLEPFGGRKGVDHGVNCAPSTTNVQKIKTDHPLGVYRVNIWWESKVKFTGVQELRRHSPDAKFSLKVTPRFKWAAKAVRAQRQWDRVELFYQNLVYKLQKCPLDNAHILAKTSIREVYINAGFMKRPISELPVLQSLFNTLPKIKGLESLVLKYPFHWIKARDRLNYLTPKEITTKLLPKCRSLKTLNIRVGNFSDLNGLDLSTIPVTSLVLEAFEIWDGRNRMSQIVLPPSLNKLEVRTGSNMGTLKLVYPQPNTRSLVTDVRVDMPGWATDFMLKLELPRSALASVRSIDMRMGALTYQDLKCLSQLSRLDITWNRFAAPIAYLSAIGEQSLAHLSMRSLDPKYALAFCRHAVAPLVRKGLKTIEIEFCAGRDQTLAEKSTFLAFPFLNIPMVGGSAPSPGFSARTRETQLKPFLTLPQLEWARPLVKSLIVTDQKLIPQAVKHCPNLTTLEIAAAQEGSLPIASLMKLKHLSNLTIREVPKEVNWNGLRLLNISRLTLHTQNVQFPTPGFLAALKRCPNLMIVKFPVGGKMTSHAADTLRNMR